MTEHVQEQPPFIMQPPPYPRQERLPVGHVFPHLYRHHPVEFLAGLELVHIRRDNDYRMKATSGSLSFDKAPLRVRIRNGRDPSVGKPLGHPQRERAPATTKLQNGLPVGQCRMLCRYFKRTFLRLGQGLGARVQAAGILAAWAQNQRKKLRP